MTSSAKQHTEPLTNCIEASWLKTRFKSQHIVRQPPAFVLLLIIIHHSPSNRKPLGQKLATKSLQSYTPNPEPQTLTKSNLKRLSGLGLGRLQRSKAKNYLKWRAKNSTSSPEFLLEQQDKIIPEGARNVTFLVTASGV